MGKLEHLGTRAHYRRLLRPRHVVGRGPTCDLVLDEPIVSGSHAELRFRGAWTVRDLGSRNGTFVNGSRITGEVQVAAGARLGFGHATPTFALQCSAPPVPFAVSLEREGREVEGSTGTLALPDPAVCAVQIAREPQGWIAESATARWRVRDRDEIEAAGRWVLHLPSEEARTMPALTLVYLGEATVRLLTSPDLEHIEVEVAHRGGVHRLDHAVLHELLYVLARARCDGTDPRGWVEFDDLCRRLSLDPTRGKDRNRLRSWIHRLRRRFEGVGVCDGARIVERREGTREVRLGVRAVRIEPLPVRGV